MTVPRRELFITTKIPGPIGRKEAYDMVNDIALKDLGVDYIDLVIIHFPCGNGTNVHDCDPWYCDADVCCGAEDHDAERIATWQGLMDLKKAGKIRAAGVSNWRPEHIKRVIAHGLEAPAVKQIQWQVALRWSTQKGITPVTASCTRSHVAGDITSFDIQLTDADMKVLDELEVD